MSVELKSAISDVVAHHMTRTYNIPALEEGIVDSIISFLPKKIKLTTAQRVRNFSLTFITFGIWDWVQAARFESGIRDNSRQGISKAISAIECGAPLYLDIDQVNALIENGCEQSLFFYLSQMDKEDFKDYATIYKSVYLGKGWTLLKGASETKASWFAEMLLSQTDSSVCPYSERALEFILRTSTAGKP